MYGGEISLGADFPLDWLSEGWSIEPSFSLPHKEMPHDEGGDQDEGQLMKETQALLDQGRSIADIEKPQ